MRERTGHLGFTLVEVMIALAVILITATGAMGIYKMGIKVNADSRRLTRATAIAQDLVDNIALWPYDDARLKDGNLGNDNDVGDATFSAQNASFTADHAEADLGTYLGLPSAALQPGGYERYWNVAEIDDSDGNAKADAKRIAVIVRWPDGPGSSSFRRVVLLTTKANPDEMGQ